MRALSTSDVRVRATLTVWSRLVIVGSVVSGAIVLAIVHAVDGITPFNYEQPPPPPHGPAAIAMVLAAIVTTGALSLRSLRAIPRRAADPGRAAMHNAVLASLLNAPLWAIVLMLLGALREVTSSGSPASALACVALLGVAVVGLIVFSVAAMLVTIPLGIAYGAVHAFAIRALHHELRAPSWRALVRMRVASLQLDALGIVVVVLVGAASDVAQCLLGSLVALLVIDVLLATHGAWNLWTALHPGSDRLRVVPLTECTVPHGLAPILPIDARTVALVDARPPTPYRALPIAVALVPRS
jgi:hypothetical protein